MSGRRKKLRKNMLWKGRLVERCTVGRRVCTAAIRRKRKSAFDSKIFSQTVSGWLFGYLVRSVHKEQGEQTDGGGNKYIVGIKFSTWGAPIITIITLLTKENGGARPNLQTVSVSASQEMPKIASLKKENSAKEPKLGAPHTKTALFHIANIGKLVFGNFPFNFLLGLFIVK